MANVLLFLKRTVYTRTSILIYNISVFECWLYRALIILRYELGNIILTVVDYKTNNTVGFSGFYVIMNDFSQDSFICFIANRILISRVNRYVLGFYGVGIDAINSLLGRMMLIELVRLILILHWYCGRVDSTNININLTNISSHRRYSRK